MATATAPAGKKEHKGAKGSKKGRKIGRNKRNGRNLRQRIRTTANKLKRIQYQLRLRRGN